MYKPIFIDDETKQHISTILKYYRSYHKIKQCDFIRYNDASVCSADTYSRIENGKIIKRNSIYTYLLYQINATYECFPPFWKQEQTKFKQLFRHLLIFQMDNYQEVATSIKEDLKGSKDFLAREIFEFMDISYDFFHKGAALDEQHFTKYLDIYSIFPNPLQDIMKVMLYQSTYFHKRNIKFCKKIFHKLHMKDSQNPLVKLIQCKEYLFEERYLDSHEIALTLEELFKKEQNHQRLFDVYSIVLLLYHKVQQGNHINVYLEKYFHLIHEYSASFHPIKYSMSLYTSGLIYFYQKKYQEAYDCFYHLCNYEDAYLPSALFINIIHDKAPNIGEYRMDTLPSNHHYPTYIVEFYQYFIDKQKHQDIEELEATLVKHVLPYCEPSDIIYWEVLKDELLSLIKDTKHYYIKKKLYPNYQENI